MILALGLQFSKHDKAVTIKKNKGNRVKSLARETAMDSASHQIRMADTASFATVYTQFRFWLGPRSVRNHLIRLTTLGLGAFLALTLGCARVQGTDSATREMESPRKSAIDQMIDATVKVALDRDGRHVMFGSGVVVASRPADTKTEAVSYVLTAAHVVAGESGATISVGFCGSRAAQGKFNATVISRGKPDDVDLAVLRVPGIAVPPIDFLEDDQLRLGKQILVLGFPEGQRLGISAGIVSQLASTELQSGIPAEHSEHRMVIDAAAPRGVSGGGTFDAETGRLVGIVQGHQTFSIAVKDQSQSYTLKFPVPGATFVVPMTQIRPFLTSPEVASALALSTPEAVQARQVLPK